MCASFRGARCGSSARRDLRGGRRATGVPTLIDKEMKKRILVAIVLCIFFCSIGIFFISILKGGATLTVYNDSSTQLNNVSVELSGGGAKDIGNIAPGKSSSARFHDYSDSSWIITVDSRSGRQRITLDSYVTGGLNFDDRVFFDSSNRTSFKSTSWTLIAPLRTIFGLGMPSPQLMLPWPATPA